MEITAFKSLLKELVDIGIEEAALDPVGDTETLVRAADKNKNILVYHTIEEQFSSKSIGIQSVRGLLSRIALFDEDKATVELVEGKTCVTGINVKQGRKRVSFRCAEPTTIKAPRRVPGELIVTNPVKLNEEYVNYLVKGFASLAFTGSKERNISVQLEGDSVTINIYDGEVDSFTDVLTFDGASYENIKGSWEVAPFQTVLKYAVKELNTADFSITEHGLAVVQLKYVNAIISPLAA